MAAARNGNGAVRWQIWVGAAALSVTIVTALIKVGDLTSSIAQNAIKLGEQQKTIEHLQEQVVSLSSIVTSGNAKYEQKFSEIETQFHAFDQLADVRIAEDLRWRAIMWEKLYGTTYPPMFYPPQIARPPPQ